MAQKDEILQRHLMIIIALEHINPLAMIRSLGEMGIYSIFIGVKHKAPVASASKYIEKFYPVSSDEEAFDVLIKNYGQVSEDTGYMPFLFFGDDSTVELSELRRNELEGRFIFFNAKENGRLTKYMDKYEILALAEKHGVKTLLSEVVDCGVMPSKVEYPIITKAISPNSGAWKGDVYICNNEVELKTAYQKIKSPQVLLQKFIDKKTEVALEGYSIQHGRKMLVGVQCTYLYNIKGYYSPYYKCEPFKKEILKSKLNAMLEEVGFEGLFEIEFIVDKDGEMYFSEINFRNSPWSHSSSKAGNPLPYLWAQSMLTGDVTEPVNFEPFNSMVEPFDFHQRVEGGMISLPQWMKEFKETKCTHYYDIEDMGPYQVMCDNWEILK